MNGTPTPASLQEPELMRRVAQRDKDAFSGLYDRYSQLAFNLAWRILNERQEAEDVVQEVFLQVWREAASFDIKRGNLSSWIVTITRSRAIDKLRSRKARRISEPGSEDNGEVAERLPEMRMTRDYLDNRILVENAFASLTREQRTAIEMAYYEGMSQSEIAEALQEPLGTVKTRIRSGLTRLREVLQPRLGNRLL